MYLESLMSEAKHSLYLRTGVNHLIKGQFLWRLLLNLEHFFWVRLLLYKLKRTEI